MAGGDLGLIRASKVKNLIEGSNTSDIIKIRSKNLGDSTGVLAKLENAIFSRTVFMNDQVKELDEKTMIYFKFASNAGTNDVLVNQYVKHLAQKLKNTTNQVIITCLDTVLVTRRAYF